MAAVSASPYLRGPVRISKRAPLLSALPSFGPPGPLHPLHPGALETVVHDQVGVAWRVP